MGLKTNESWMPICRILYSTTPTTQAGDNLSPAFTLTTLTDTYSICWRCAGIVNVFWRDEWRMAMAIFPCELTTVTTFFSIDWKKYFCFVCLFIVVLWYIIRHRHTATHPETQIIPLGRAKLITSYPRPISIFRMQLQNFHGILKLKKTRRVSNF